MKLKLASPEQVAMVYKRDLKPSFPPSELKPLANIQAMCRDGCYQPWCLFDGEEIAGECFLWLGRPGWALLDYLCVAEDRRNSGAGALMLKLLRRAEGDTVILVERRLGFYARNGLRTAGYDTDVFGAHYKTLYLSEGPVPDGRLMEENRFIYRDRFPKEKYERYVRIPRDPAAGPIRQVPWNED